MRRAPVLLYAGILAVSAIPGDDLSGLPVIVGTAGHVGAYACLALLLVATGRSGAATVAWCVLAATLNEVEQTFVPGRSGDVTDIAVDVLAALAGVLVAAHLRRQRVFEGSGSSAV